MILSNCLLSLFCSLFFFTQTFQETNNTQATEIANLTIEISNVKTKEGRVLLGLYFPTDDFPHYPTGEYVFEKQTGTTFTYTLENVKIGSYAISVMDDTNDNDEMDYNFIGLPKEGYGFSNNAGPRGFKPPRFEDCAFEVKEGENFIQIKMKYWTF